MRSSREDTLDLRVPPKEEKLLAVEAQTHRRFIKTHLPVDALVYSPGAKYIFVGRDGRDVAWSFYNHWEKANATFYDALNNTPDWSGFPSVSLLQRPISISSKSGWTTSSVMTR